MADSPYVFDATAENFRALVLENSDKGPVLVNYWSPRAGPCLMLMPRLVRLAAEFGGRFLLVMLNTDELGPLAREHGVHSLPTVKLFRRSKVVDTLHGAESEAVLREFISKHLARESGGNYASALQAYQRGDLDQAVAQADGLLKSLPDEVRDHSEIRNLAAHVGFIRAAQAAPPVEQLELAIRNNPDDLEARYQLSALKITQDKFDEAMQQLLEIVRRDSAFRDQAGRDGLLAVFNLLGENDERVQRYRVMLNQALH